MLYQAMALSGEPEFAAQWIPMFDTVLARRPEYWMAVDTFAGLRAASIDLGYALPHLEGVFRSRGYPELDPFILEFLNRAGLTLKSSGATVHIDGIAIDMALSRELTSIRLVLSLLEAGRVAEALGAAETLPPSDVGRLVRAETAITAGRPDLALAASDTITAIDHITAMTLAVRATALGTLGRYREAVDCATCVLLLADQAPPSRQRARLEAAGALAKLGHTAEAESHLRALLHENPGDRRAATAIEHLW
jgi:tetratricopeptide (TPR) repeat protein